MKKVFAAMGVALPLLLFVVPASARSIKEKLGSTLFAASPQDSIFLTVSGPNGPIPLLSASPIRRRFGQPIQSGGPAGIAQYFTKGLSTEILTESAVVPVPSGSAGFSYVYNPDLNIFERRSIGLGSIFNERVSTLGKGVFAFGVAYVRQDFDTFNGDDLTKLEFGVDKNTGKEISPFSQQKLSSFLQPGVVGATVDLNITTNTAALYGIYGVADWLDISLLLPITEISVRAKSQIFQGSDTFLTDVPVFFPDSRCTIERAKAGQCRLSDFTVIRRRTAFTLIGKDGKQVTRGNPIQNTVDETRAGVGDLIMRGKARFLDGTWGALGGLTEFTFPTGDKDNFLGDDAFKARFLLLYSIGFFENRLNFHLNGGGKITTQTSDKDTLEYGSTVDLMVTPRLSLIAELIGSWRVDSGGLPENFVDGAFGFKVNPFAGLILSASFRIPATDDGLRSDLVYLAGLEYDF